MNIKNKKNNEGDYRVGRRIKARSVRLIDFDGTNLGVVSTRDAMDKAENLGLDLVEVGAGDPPTCKILDYGKLKYEQSKKEKKKEKKNYEIQFRPKIAEHDLVVKINRARRFLEEGSIVNFVVQLRGREILHPETGQVILDRVNAELKEISNEIKKPVLSGKNIFMILGPKSG